MESYRDLVDIDGNGTQVEVEMLRIGRGALMYQTKDKSRVGAWDKATSSWQELDSGYRRAVDEGIRIAKKLATRCHRNANYSSGGAQ